jgi:molybdate transport system ATP-binding protein
VAFGMSGLIANFTTKRSDAFQVEIQLAIPAGKTVALLGPNAAGKSTVVDTIAGLIRVEKGIVGLDDRVFDEPASGTFIPAESRNIGVMFQDYLLFPNMTVAENIAFGLRSQGRPRSETGDAAQEWIGRMGLTSVANQFPGTISGGQAQRVALARALICEPDLLLLDEPLSALDVTTRGDLQTELREHLEEFSGPRLLITHDPREAFLFADEIHIIEEGLVTQSGDPSDIKLRPKTRYAADIGGGWAVD